jgi:two-component system nitrogen regulation response regulator GlnG
LRSFAEEANQQPKTLSEAAHAIITGHIWPGNVRELLNTLKRASVLASGPVIQVSDLGISAEGQGMGDGEGTFEDIIHHHLRNIVKSWSHLEEGDLYQQVLEKVEKPLFELLMESVKGNQLKAARILGINRNTLRERLRKYGLLNKK